LTDSLNGQPPMSYNVLLIGDTCTDEYVYGTCTKLNPESPVPILSFKHKETKMGMSGNVLENLKSFNIKVTHITNREKITKTRYVDERYNHQLLRVDDDIQIETFLGFLPEDNFDAVVISDYAKGFLTIDKIYEIVETYTCPIFIDSKKVHLPDAEHVFIKINESESQKLRTRPKNLIVTLGERGTFFNNTIYQANKVNVFDVVGAGDTFISALTYFYLETNSIENAIIKANRAAAIAVQHRGTYVLTKEDINEIRN